MPVRRMFCALMLGPELGGRLAESTRAALELPRPGLRAVAPGDLHLTLCFVGALSPEAVGAVAEGLTRTLAGARRPALRIAGADAFPARGRERVLIARVSDGGSRGLVDLAGRATRAAREAGALPEVVGEGPRELAFAPHVTLARVRSARPGARAAVPAAFYAQDFSLLWQPPRVAWVESPGGGAGYRVVAEVPLEGP